MYNIVSKYVSTLTKEDIFKFAINNNLKATDKEIDFIYNFIKNNYKEVLKNPNKFDISLYKENFSNENYIFIEKLINKYKRMII